MSSLLTGLGTGLGTVVGTVTGTGSGSGGTGSGGTTTPPATDTTTTPVTTTPAAPTAVSTGTSKLQWAMVAGQTVYVSARAPFGPSPWVPWTVAYVWPDGDAILTSPGKQALRTDMLRVVTNLRRQGEVYPDDANAGAMP